MRITIEGQDFLIDGAPTYPGRTWRGQRIEGLLLNARMVQATFDDLNPDHPRPLGLSGHGRWDPERNVSELIAMLPEYRRHGLLAITVNFQGGSPEGYSREQPWENSGLRSPTARSDPTLPTACGASSTAADAAGMAVIVGYFYQGQDERLADESAVLQRGRPGDRLPARRRLPATCWSRSTTSATRATSTPSCSHRACTS